MFRVTKSHFFPRKLSRRNAAKANTQLQFTAKFKFDEDLHVTVIFTSENTNGVDASDTTAVWRKLFSNFCTASFINLTRRLCHKKRHIKCCQ